MRTFGMVAWESTGSTCPAPGSPGRYDCFNCGATGVSGTDAEAWQHAMSCQPPA